jgi:uroporphyrinogen decarboxylase
MVKPSMTPRDRVLAALNHEEPDRLPMFMGASGATSMLAPLYEKFKQRFGVDSPTRFLSRASQQVMIDERVRDALGGDGQVIVPGPPVSTLAKEVSDDCFIDAFGVTWRRRPGDIYFEVEKHPLRNATIDDLERYPWPDLAHPSRFVGLRERAKTIQESGQAVVLFVGAGVFSPAFEIRGVEQILYDLGGNEDFATALMTKLEELFVACLKAALKEAGDYVDVVITGDDLGNQSGPMMSPAMYRRLIKPHHARIFAAIRENTKAKIYLHSRGDVYRLIGDLIEVGVDLLNPVQVSAGEMGDTARLKREFGDRLAFNGAIDTQRVMPFGSPEDVRAEVRRRIRDLAPGGGYIAGAVHCIQSDVPVENVLAMCDEIQTAGRYPIAL